MNKSDFFPVWPRRTSSGFGFPTHHERLLARDGARGECLRGSINATGPPKKGGRPGGAASRALATTASSVSRFAAGATSRRCYRCGTFVGNSFRAAMSAHGIEDLR